MAVKRFPGAKSLKKLQSFFRLTGYFRKFVMKGRQSHSVICCEACLILYLMVSNIKIVPIIHKRIDAILMQKKIQRYYIRLPHEHEKTSQAEENLCIIYINKISDYLLGVEFKVNTDCQALTSTIRKKNYHQLGALKQIWPSRFRN